VKNEKWKMESAGRHLEGSTLQWMKVEL